MAFGSWRCDGLITSEPYGVSGACRPWDSLDAQRRPRRVHTCDPQEQIDKCLACEREDCASYSCPEVGGMNKNKAERIKRELEPLLRAGIKRKDIAQMLGVTTSTVRRWIEKLGLNRKGGTHE